MAETAETDLFRIPDTAFLMGVGLPYSDVDTATQLRMSNPNVYFGRVVEPYRKGAARIIINNVLDQRYTKFMLDGSRAVHHHRAKNGAAIIDVLAKRPDKHGCARWLLMTYSGDALEFAWCQCHEKNVIEHGPAQILCLAHRVLNEIREGILTTSIRI